MGIYGIDISEHNGDIDLSPYKDQFVMIRAGWGWSKEQQDKKFERSVKECMRLNIPFGVYWYSYAVDEDSAGQEAQVFLDVIRPYKNAITYGVWVDQEDADGWKMKNGFQMNKACISKITSIICSALEKEGYHTGIYCSYSWLKYLDDSCLFFDRWVAHWGRNDGERNGDYSDVASIHQFTDTPLDRDYCYKGTEHFKYSRKQVL